MEKESSKENKLIQSLEELTNINLNHNTGQKRVFLQNGDTPTNITQVAFAYIQAGNSIENHIHPTMEEHFYIVKGDGVFVINNQHSQFTPQTFIRIPANTSHSILAQTDLEFIYWGIATTE